MIDNSPRHPGQLLLDLKYKTNILLNNFSPIVLKIYILTNT